MARNILGNAVLDDVFAVREEEDRLRVALSGHPGAYKARMAVDDQRLLHCCGSREMRRLVAVDCREIS